MGRKNGRASGGGQQDNVSCIFCMQWGSCIYKYRAFEAACIKPEQVQSMQNRHTIAHLARQISAIVHCVLEADRKTDRVTETETEGHFALRVWHLVSLALSRGIYKSNNLWAGLVLKINKRHKVGWIQKGKWIWEETKLNEVSPQIIKRYS